MGFYSRLSALIPEQSCVLCAENAKFCICHECESSFSSHQPRCKSCAHPIGGKLDFCGQCLAHAPVFNRAYTLYDYQGAIADLIKIFKFDHRLCVGDYFSHQLYDLYQSIVSKDVQYDAIIPMPLSRSRMSERGYNQVLELLRVISKKTNTIIDTHSVDRIKATQPLSALNPEQRRQEIKGAFSVKPMPYSKVLLVDDVMTTGSSLNELASTILKNTDVKYCDVMTLARAESKFN